MIEQISERGFKMMIRSILFAVIVCFFASFVSAQMYQYRDENGNLCFTDDPGRIPRSQQETAKSMPSIKAPAQMNTLTEEGMNVSGQEIDTEDEINIPIKGAKELYQMKEDLDNIYNILQEKRANLQFIKHAENASSEESTALLKEILEFNAEVEAYQKRREKYEKHVKEFNFWVEQNENK